MGQSECIQLIEWNYQNILNIRNNHRKILCFQKNVDIQLFEYT